MFVDDVPVLAENMTGEERRGFRCTLSGMCAERNLIAAECVDPQAEGNQAVPGGAKLDQYGFVLQCRACFGFATELLMIASETIEECKSFIGRAREVTDSMAPEPAAKLSQLLGTEFDGHLPLCWHWAYFNLAIPPEHVGHDGHERLGRFLPDVPLPRRMWAAGEIEIISPLKVGVVASRRSTIETVEFKRGQTGDLCFVTVHHEITQSRPVLVERQTIVYREQ